jgi:hypothetical protein
MSTKWWKGTLVLLVQGIGSVFSITRLRNEEKQGQFRCLARHLERARRPILGNYVGVPEGAGQLGGAAAGEGAGPWW